MLRDLLTRSPSVLIRGSRMVGKTTLAKRVCGDRGWDLSDGVERKEFLVAPEQFLREIPKPVLIDEWQAYPDALPIIKRLIDSEGLRGVVLAGSAEAPPGSWGASRQFPLGGRSRDMTLWPLTVAERRGVHRADLMDELFSGAMPQEPERLEHTDYMRLIFESGYPAALGQDEVDTGDYLRSVQRGAVQMLLSQLGEVVNGNGVTDRHEPHVRASQTTWKRFIQTCASQSSKELRPSKLATAVGLDERTAQRYTLLLEDMHLATTIETWRHQPSMLPAKQRKLYIAEAAMMPAFTERTTREIASDSVTRGGAVETFVNAQLQALASVSSPSFAIERYHLPSSSRLADEYTSRGATPFPVGEINFLLRTWREAEPRVIAIEVRASEHYERQVLRRVTQLRKAFDDRRELGHPGFENLRYTAGIILCAGNTRVRRAGEKEWIAPLSILWS